MTTDAELFEALKYRVTVDRLGTRRYYNSKGKLHRDAGPAVVCEGVAKEWWFKGVRHRINGPAVEHTNGNKEWWLNGKKYAQQEYYTLLKTLEQVHGY